ncbi:ADP-ribosylglycohydrolase family protein [Lamprobacter modestohalophilus]|uniref:ADP-ribosylglycohydrolase family protein n=1 Tax=Lamprobacter modestohalophilus TaxID=1064514 RepID=A0A9X0WB91_9GAMM|nr:ADP-ribosylglycohydrolase family protein [Lamprobacter modestohalophilus]MBK1619743.1 hypothetical protein [Lamprobacter modestohalophilus]MEA1048267.1 ADP-ribosylglycohydrolase family protein [Lamprobacter modestohalophilus]
MDRLAELLAPEDTRDVISAVVELDLVARPAARVVAELGVYYTLSGNEDEEPVADTDAAEEFETPATPVWRSKRQQKRTVQRRFLGCLLGGAVGDALGAPVEFMKRAEILRRFGPKGITQYAPGNTCLSALRAMNSLGEPARNDRKGCGGVMRVAPVGLFAWRLRQYESPQDTFRLGTELAALTHGHPTGALTGGVLAVLILALTDGASLREALAAAKPLLRAEPDHEETLRAIEMAEELADFGLAHRERLISSCR